MSRGKSLPILDNQDSAPYRTGAEGADEPESPLAPMTCETCSYARNHRESYASCSNWEVRNLHDRSTGTDYEGRPYLTNLPDKVAKSVKSGVCLFWTIDPAKTPGEIRHCNHCKWSRGDNYCTSLHRLSPEGGRKYRDNPLGICPYHEPSAFTRFLRCFGFRKPAMRKID